MLIRVYNSPGCLDLQNLCIIPKQQCWVLYIDILVSAESIHLEIFQKKNSFFEVLIWFVSGKYSKHFGRSFGKEINTIQIRIFFV